MTDGDAAERANSGSKGRAPAVILEAGQDWEPTRRVRCDDAFADQATVAGARREVDESESVEDLAVGRFVGGAELLESGTHCEHHGTTRKRVVDRGA